jgi:hypothetical protein
LYGLLLIFFILKHQKINSRRVRQLRNQYSTGQTNANGHALTMKTTILAPKDQHQS